MKKKIILPVLFSLVVTVAFSQVNKHEKFELSPKAFSQYKFSIPVIPIDTSYYKNQYNIPLNDESFSPFKYSEGASQNGNDSDSNQRYIDNMPCLRPEGLLTMKILRPDTASNYTMLIK